MGPPLVRASEFCRRRDAAAIAGSATVPVRIQLQQHPCRIGRDGAAASAVCHGSVLRAVGVTQGRPVCLRVGSRSVVVPLCLQTKEETHKCAQVDGSSSLIKEHCIAVNALTALNLGCGTTLLDALTGDDNSIEKEAGGSASEDAETMKRKTPAVVGNGTSMKVSGHVHAVTLGTTVDAEEVILQLLRRPMSEPTATEILLPPPALPLHGTLLCPDTLLEVGRPKSEHSKGDVLSIYHIVSVNQQRCNNDTSTGSIGEEKGIPVYISTRETHYRIESPDTAPATIPRLPPLSSNHVPHPDGATWASLWSTLSGASVLPIWHVVGTQTEHHVRVAATAAAHRMGRQCCLVSGLTAFAVQQQFHRRQASLSSSSPSEVSSSTITGTALARDGAWPDALCGLTMAVQHAIRLAPSLLVLERIDEDIGSVDGTELEDRQARVWAVLSEAVTADYSHSGNGNNNRNSSLDHVPAVVVVMVTRAPLTPGPWMQNLVYATAHASMPDSDYTGYLWNATIADLENQYRQRKTQSFTTIDTHTMCSLRRDTVPLETVKELMIGRPVQDIVEVCHELWYCCIEQSIEEDDSTAVTTALTALCQIRDKARQRQNLGPGQIPLIRWSDIGGLVHVRREIMDAIELPLLHPHMFGSRVNGDRSQSGVLLYGPPGTGKTLVAKAVATECGLPFISVKGPELLGSFVGESESNVRAIFEQSRTLSSQNQPPGCILFFDELDSLAPRRGESGGNVMDRVVATFFTELDKSGSIFCMAATNRPDLLDPSLLRPGRFDRLVYLGVSANEHVGILTTQLSKLKLESDTYEMASAIAKTLPSNLTGADLSTIASGALLRATERLCKQVDRVVLEEHESTHGNGRSIDQVLESWCKEKLEPVVTFEDLLKASEAVVPSVSQSDILRYELLGETYSRLTSKSLFHEA